MFYKECSNNVLISKTQCLLKRLFNNMAKRINKLIVEYLFKAFQRLNNIYRNLVISICRLKNRLRLQNRDITLIASDCNGAVILHELGLRFNSPFVNLWIGPSDFVKLCGNLDYYMNCDMGFVQESDIKYPVGVLDDVRVYFQHYKTDQEAKDNWEKRKKRMNMDSVFILFTDRNGCSYDDLKQFDNLDWKNKVVLTHKKYDKIKSSVYVPGYDEADSVGVLVEYRKEFPYTRYLEMFDYVSWFNSALM